MADNQKIRSRFIPQNATDSGRILNGLLKKRNLIEAGVICAPVGIILWISLSMLPMVNRIQITTIVVCVLGAVALLGFPPYSIFEFISLMARFSKKKHYAKYNPRPKWEAQPTALIEQNGGSLMEALSNGVNKILDGAEDSSSPVAEGIYNPQYKEAFKDDPAQKVKKERQRKKTKKEKKEVKK